MVKVILALVVVLLAVPAHGQISNDRLCKAIGDTPNVAVPPRDRAFFQDHCECLIGECVYKGGARYRQLMTVVKCKVEVKKAVPKMLGRDIDSRDPLGPFDDFGIIAEALCMKEYSGQKVMKKLQLAIKEQRSKDQEEIESRKRAEEAAERHRQELAVQQAKLEADRAAWLAKREEDRDALIAAGNVDGALMNFVSCLGDSMRDDCKSEASTFWDVCEETKTPDCQKRYDRARAAQLQSQPR